MFAQVILFFAFGVGLDPRQARVFGPALSPILIGFAVAFCSNWSSGVFKLLDGAGYTGACKFLFLFLFFIFIIFYIFFKKKKKLFIIQ
jgi:hypothetical protein